ncbi:MAG: PH domain-containing protein [Clostridia bacterium]|nr:PH domain-containing protein [Clostridia bacterium]
MEKFKSKIGTITFLLFLIIGFVDLILLMLWGIYDIWIPFLVYTILFIIFVIPPYFFTSYSLTKDYLEINCLWIAIKKKIKYEDIVSVTPCNCSKISAKLCSECIRVVYIKRGKTKEIFISPAMYDRFVNFLTDNVLSSVVINDSGEEKSTFNEDAKQKQIKAEKLKADKKVVLKNKQDIKQKTRKTVKKKTIK